MIVQNDVFYPCHGHVPKEGRMSDGGGRVRKLEVSTGVESVSRSLFQSRKRFPLSSICQSIYQ
jgi:hypothetical protein